MSTFTTKYLGNVRNENTNTITGLKSLTNNMNSEIIRMNNEIDNLTTSLSSMSGLINNLDTELNALELSAASNTSLTTLEGNVNNNTSAITSLSSVVSNNTSSINSLTTSLTSLSSVVSNIPNFEIINDLDNVGTTKLLQSQALKQLLKRIIKAIITSTIDEELENLLITYNWVKILEDNGTITIKEDEETAETITSLNAINYLNENMNYIKNIVISHDLATNLTFNLTPNQNLIIETDLANLNDALTGINATGGTIWKGIEQTATTTTINLSTTITCENLYLNNKWCQFIENKSLKNVIVGLDVKTFITENFSGCSKLLSADCQSLTSIGNSTFSHCTSLTKINLPNLKSCGNYTFSYCTSLKSINLPNFNSSNYKMFSNCSSLEYIYMPKCYWVKDNVFEKCTSLNEIHMASISGNLSNGGTNLFKDINSGTINIYIHSNSLSNSNTSATYINTNKAGSCTLTFYYGENDNWTQIKVVQITL